MKAKKKHSLKILKLSLSRRVDEQRYEDAAKIRDEISALKNSPDIADKSSYENNNSGSADKGKDE